MNPIALLLAATIDTTHIGPHGPMVGPTGCRCDVCRDITRGPDGEPIVTLRAPSPVLPRPNRAERRAEASRQRRAR